MYQWTGTAGWPHMRYKWRAAAVKLVTMALLAGQLVPGAATQAGIMMWEPETLGCGSDGGTDGGTDGGSDGGSDGYL